MKKYLWSLLAIMMAAFMSFNLVACGDDDDEPGSIYGIVTKNGTTEVLKGVPVELHVQGDSRYTYISQWPQLMSTVTFDDGHFEFNNLNPGEYGINIELDDYHWWSSLIIVEPNRQARIDVSLRKW